MCTLVSPNLLPSVSFTPFLELGISVGYDLGNDQYYLPSFS